MKQKQINCLAAHQKLTINSVDFTKLPVFIILDYWFKNKEDSKVIFMQARLHNFIIFSVLQSCCDLTGARYMHDSITAILLLIAYSIALQLLIAYSLHCVLITDFIYFNPFVWASCDFLGFSNFKNKKNKMIV